MTTPGSLAIVHFHLWPGGVTRVIEHACAALREHGVRIVVLTGEAPADWSAPGAEVRIVKALGYDEAAPVPAASPAALQADLAAAAADALGAPPDVWHFHNHALGKNVALPGAVRRLADAGRRLLLQVHDFAEDGRPDNYRRLIEHVGGSDTAALGRSLYPQAPQVHYAVLNGRDGRCLANAGVDADRLHLLPNAVALHDAPANEIDDAPAAAPPHRDGRLLLYPTRAIRRKNLGECLLWAAVAQPGDRFGITRAPQNPTQRAVYEQWRAFARQHDLPVDFEVGQTRDVAYVQLLQSADALITTSVAEGFGLVFLEPWLVNRPLVGRNLTAVTGQFSDAGVDLSALYDQLDVPVDWVGADDLRQRVRQAMDHVFKAYGQPCAAAAVDAAVDSMIVTGRVDFGRLDEPMQQRVIQRVRTSPRARDELRPPSLLAVGSSPADTAAHHDTLAHNAQVVHEVYSLPRYGRRLVQVYQALMASDPRQPVGLSAELLLRQFLAPARFNLLRT